MPPAIDHSTRRIGEPSPARSMGLLDPTSQLVHKAVRLRRAEEVVLEASYDIDLHAWYCLVKNAEMDTISVRNGVIRDTR